MYDCTSAIHQRYDARDQKNVVKRFTAYEPSHNRQ